MFIFTENVKMQQMNVMKDMIEQRIIFNVSIESFTQQTLMSDLLYLEYAVEEEDLMRAVAEHQIQKDPEIKQLLTDNMKKLPPQVMKVLMAGVTQNNLPELDIEEEIHHV